ncbi:hypothetical protein [Ancylobacter amanitiformis]|uniref:Uncharacterized protein n=1 Tax=Ancylobacter amanitiformis TaxID=217069 RepID=A0ABU0LTE5_9HYPH|nr:hypothetical protein [Ancylobacter amanitiformis]MDQ0511977.1 hypothetical protein [Ancylobacter amanitiformis]
MIRFLLRFIGMWVLAGGFVALVLDGVRSIAASQVVMTPLGVAWLVTSEESLGHVQAFISEKLSPRVWDVIAPPLLQAPLFLVLGVIGAGLLVLGWRRPAR